ncbi:MAG: hypothetical protein GY945_03040 [Rhodobacteraceae bacterium]|nr:hypothetical protein [Paracoccaceae bacterium]
MLERIVATLDQGAPLSDADRRNARLLADQLAGFEGFVAYLMLSDSVAGKFRYADDTRILAESFDFTDVTYLTADSIFTNGINSALPLISKLLAGSDRRGDDIVAGLLSARVLLAAGRHKGGLAQLQELLKSANARGFSPAELHSLHMDLWATATLTGNTELVAAQKAPTLACRQSFCAEDLLWSFFERSKNLAEVPVPHMLHNLNISVGEQFARTHLDSDPLWLSDFHSFQTGIRDSRPMDAANSAELAVRYAEAAPGISPEDLVARVASEMEVLIYAAHYDTALDIAARIAAHLAAEGHGGALSPVFFHRRARAAFHVGAAEAESYFREAIVRFKAQPDLPFAEALIADLVLDLQDTPWLELQQEAMALGYNFAPVLARLRYRQGRYEEAARLMAKRRAYLVDEATRNPALTAELDASAWQEAFYREAAGETQKATTLRTGTESPVIPAWVSLSKGIVTGEQRVNLSTRSSYDLILPIIEFRDDGNYEGAAYWMRSYRWLAILAEENGAYLDAQTLWQMAFTFVRSGDADIAFDLMNRAARIAARLSFENAGGADGGSLQLLERDRWRYLLFIDIAWAAVTGKSPEELSVVSRY